MKSHAGLPCIVMSSSCSLKLLLVACLWCTSAAVLPSFLLRLGGGTLVAIACLRLAPPRHSTLTGDSWTGVNVLVPTAHLVWWIAAVLLLLRMDGSALPVWMVAAEMLTRTGSAAQLARTGGAVLLTFKDDVAPLVQTLSVALWVRKFDAALLACMGAAAVVLVRTDAAALLGASASLGRCKEVTQTMWVTFPWKTFTKSLSKISKPLKQPPLHI